MFLVCYLLLNRKWEMKVEVSNPNYVLISWINTCQMRDWKRNSTLWIMLTQRRCCLDGMEIGIPSSSDKSSIIYSLSSLLYFLYLNTSPHLDHHLLHKYFSLFIFFASIVVFVCLLLWRNLKEKVDEMRISFFWSNASNLKHHQQVTTL